MKLLKVLAVVVFAISASLLIAQDQKTLRIRSAYGAGDPAYADYVAALVRAPLTSGDAFAVLLNGDQIFPAMLGAIRSAKHRISLETYIYSTGAIADAFTHELSAAASRGVEVRIVLDALGAQDIAEDRLAELKQAGCHIGSFNPTRWYSFEEVNYRTHRKILVVDGAVAFTGGAGMADHWMGHAQDRDHWRDTQVKIIGPAARSLEAAFSENWIESAEEAKPALDPPTAPSGVDARALVVWGSPTGGSSDLKRLYLLCIAGARRTLDISSPYFVIDESSRWAIEQARSRGVRIRVLVEGDVTDAKPVKYASRAGYESLLKNGVEIYEYQPTMMHAKAMVVDGIWSMFGSANFDNRSLELNDEVNVAVRDPALAAKFLASFEDDLSRSRRLRYERWRSRPVSEKVRDRFWSLFSEVF